MAKLTPSCQVNEELAAKEMCTDTTPPYTLQTTLPASRPTLLAPSKIRWAGFRNRRPEDKQHGEVSGAAKDEEEFHMGLQRNILHLSNVVRTQQEELASLREQVKLEDDQQMTLKAQIKFDQAQVVDTMEPEQLGFMHYGKLVIAARRVAVGCQQKSSNRAKQQQEESNRNEDDSNTAAIVAFGEDQTTQHLLRVNRDLRSQLGQSDKQAEAFRLASVHLDRLEEEKTELRSRLDHMADQLKLQVAPLTALQLDLKQARLETETMRTRLSEERKETRIRREASEKDCSQLHERAKELENDLAGTLQACQRESMKASKYEGMYTKATLEMTSLKEQLGQSKIDARMIAQELFRMRDSAPGLSPCQTTSTQTSPVSIDEAEDHVPTPTDIPKGRSSHNDAEAMEAQLFDLEAQLLQTQEQLERAERGKAEAKYARTEEDNAGLIAKVEDLETSQAELERRLDCSGPMAQQQRIQSIRAELCRTIDRMRAAEDALEVALTCLNCTKLLRNPQLMVPCGHTLCGDCCYRSSGEEQCDKREELELVSTPPEWSAGAGTTSREERVHTQGVGTACCLCRKEWNGKGGESRPEASREGTMMAPNRAVAAMVGKFMFRRHCLEALKLIGQALWKEGDKEEKSTA